MQTYQVITAIMIITVVSPPRYAPTSIAVFEVCLPYSCWSGINSGLGCGSGVEVGPGCGSGVEVGPGCGSGVLHSVLVFSIGLVLFWRKSSTCRKQILLQL